MHTNWHISAKKDKSGSSRELVPLAVPWLLSRSV